LQLFGKSVVGQRHVLVVRILLRCVTPLARGGLIKRLLWIQGAYRFGTGRLRTWNTWLAHDRLRSAGIGLVVELAVVGLLTDTFRIEASTVIVEGTLAFRVRQFFHTGFARRVHVSAAGAKRIR
jgi:hypothetical protein